MDTTMDLELDLQQEFNKRIKDKRMELYVEAHIKFLSKALDGLKSSFTGLDASNTWLMYWIFNALAILETPIIIRDTCELNMPCILLDANEVVSRQIMFRSVDGGFGGGPGQLSHLAPTFSAINAIILSKTYDIIERKSLAKFIKSLKQKDGSFIMHQGGESDLRASYCALVASYICNIIDSDMLTGVADFIASCQTYEGGFGALPGNEAHAGYTFCGFAALIIAEGIEKIDLFALERWVMRKISNQGGFTGRANKLVDSCYCYWTYALVPLIEYAKKNLGRGGKHHELIDRKQLAKYLLCFAQMENGGFCDRYPGYPDFYHTCYSLCSLSLTVYDIQIDPSDFGKLSAVDKAITGIDVKAIHPLFGIPLDNFYSAINFFY